jgi:membrane-associated HD superfamily phosphohydrolase
MKKLILLFFILFSRVILATEPIAYEVPSYIESVSLYKTIDKSLSISEIRERVSFFKPIEENETFSQRDMWYWIKLKLNNILESGKYGIYLYPFTFDLNSFAIGQEEKGGENYLLFNYDAEKDAQEYYFRISAVKVEQPFRLMVKEEMSIIPPPAVERFDFYSNPELLIVFCGFGMGLVFMAGIYNGAIFYTNRKKEFLFYALMQMGMLLLLYSLINQFHYMFPWLYDKYGLIGLSIAFFATLFTKYFLDTKENLPVLNSVFTLYLIAILMDAVWLDMAFIENYHLYSLFGGLFLVASIMRIVQGWQVAWFYLIAWLGLIGATFLMEYFPADVPFYTFYLGAGFEAIILAWGLAYKMKVYNKK